LALTPDSRPVRQAALVASLPEGIDALLVTHLPNIRWLTGFTGSAAVLLVARDRCTLITDFRYAAQAPGEVGSAAEVIIDRASVWDRLRRVLEAHTPVALAVESHIMPVRDAERVSSIFRGRVMPLADAVEQLRQVKDDIEVAAIRAAAALAAEALAEVLPTVTVGTRELDVAARLELALRRRGSEWHPFPTIVASGPRAALPHARSSARPVERGEFLLIDFGAQVDGYCADITRTVAVGPVDDRQRAVYDLVREAQLRARDGIRAGITGRAADALARDLIDSRGYGDAFGHSLGHGLGLEVHEAPRLAATAEVPLPVGAVVTIEPGIYLSGWGGVRLEDDVWLGPDGPVLLSDGRTDLIILDA
jgi:Xaa-Pro aminopeptidase